MEELLSNINHLLNKSRAAVRDLAQETSNIEENFNNKMHRPSRGRAMRGSSFRGIIRGQASNSVRHRSRSPKFGDSSKEPRDQNRIVFAGSSGKVKEDQGLGEAKLEKIEENTMENIKIPKVSRTRIEGPGQAKRAKIEENTMENDKIPIVSRTRIEETLRDIRCCECREYLLLSLQNFSEKIKIYVCHRCQKYKCESCFSREEFHEGSEWHECVNSETENGGGRMVRDSNLELLALSWLELERQNRIIKDQQKELKAMKNQVHVDFSNNFQCHYSSNGCGEEFMAKKAHEFACIYQKVPCPAKICNESILFKDVYFHVDQTHNMLKINKEWDFDGSKEDLLQTICCLTSYKQQFFPKFYVKGDLLYYKIIMLGHQDTVNPFKVCINFFGQKNS